ncbi:MAG: hypothetical protein LBC44_03315 [Mycoplasmataceae bacterium]|jgi:inosine/xanthosine triphosphate pyrophosphatase family protein|nr:hypothetical protein [Mycoplasmataceae bacterium]
MTKKKFLIATKDNEKFEKYVKILEPTLGKYVNFISLNDIKTEIKYPKLASNAMSDVLKQSMDLSKQTGCICMVDEMNLFEIPLTPGEYIERYLATFKTKEECFDIILKKAKKNNNYRYGMGFEVVITIPNSGFSMYQDNVIGTLVKKYDSKYSGVEKLENGVYGFGFIFVEEKSNKPLTEMTTAEYAKIDLANKVLKRAGKDIVGKFDGTAQKKMEEKTVKIKSKLRKSTD